MKHKHTKPTHQKQNKTKQKIKQPKTKWILLFGEHEVNPIYPVHFYFLRTRLTGQFMKMHYFEEMEEKEGPGEEID